MTISSDKLHFQPEEALIAHAPVNLTNESSGNCTSFGFCDCGQTITPLWKNNGVSLCFYELVTSLPMVLSMIFLFVQIHKIKK